MQRIKSLAVEQTSFGETVNIKNINMMGNSPVMLFYLQQYVQLNEAGYGHPVLNAGNKSSAIYAEIDGKVVGIIAYRIEDDPLETAWIILSAVDPNYRKRGIYKLMHTSFENHVISLGSRKISSHVHINNKVRQASCESVGMIPVWYKMEKSIPQTKK